MKTVLIAEEFPKRLEDDENSYNLLRDQYLNSRLIKLHLFYRSTLVNLGFTRKTHGFIMAISIPWTSV